MTPGASANPLLIARRATDVIAAACRAFGGPVRVPALYCAEVVDAIEAAGCPVSCYDVAADLSASAPLDTGEGVLVWHHAFGRYLRPPTLAGAVVVEDACFGLRTLMPMVGQLAPELLVMSPRKEFGWTDGGVAIGRRLPDLRAAIAAARDDVLTRWRGLDLAGEVARGAAATEYARAALGDRLPPGGSERDVLTVLPLLSDQRDTTIDALRTVGVAAWCWQRRLTGCTPTATPVAWRLWQRLLLVPLPEPGGPAYRSLAAHTFAAWSAGPD